MNAYLTRLAVLAKLETRWGAASGIDMSAACKIKVAGRPCESRPWSKDRDAPDIPEFSLEMAESLAATCPDERGMGPDFVAKWFARHLSPRG